MESVVSRFGIFEIIGYLAAGIVVDTLIAFPWFIAPQPAVPALEPYLRAGLEGHVALFAVTYVVGIAASGVSMWYYDGRKNITRPPTHPLDKSGNESKLRSSGLWSAAHHKLTTHGIFDHGTWNAHLTPADLQDIYMLRGYSLPAGDMLDRIASVVRLSAATTVACILGIASTGASFVFRYCSDLLGGGYGMALLSTYALLCVLGAIQFHLKSREYAESFWRHLAAALVTQTSRS